MFSKNFLYNKHRDQNYLDEKFLYFLEDAFFRGFTLFEISNRCRLSEGVITNHLLLIQYQTKMGLFKKRTNKYFFTESAKILYKELCSYLVNYGMSR
jgi:hypothetical protein